MSGNGCQGGGGSPDGACQKFGGHYSFWADREKVVNPSNLVASRILDWQ